MCMPAHAGQDTDSKTKPADELVVDINNASAKELAELPGVGNKVAARIVNYREKNGRFQKAEEIMNVRGIGEKTFDVVVTDIRMDNINGMEVLNRVIEKGEHTLVIMITGYATIEIAREAQAKGAFDFISKPFRPKDLKAAIDKAAASLEADGKP